MIRMQIVIDSGEITNVFVSDVDALPVVSVVNGDDSTLEMRLMTRELIEEE